jgi:gluconate 2-dehydrogenase gamma chain
VRGDAGERHGAPDTEGVPVELTRRALSRRFFLRTVGAAGAGFAATQLVGCGSSSNESVAPSDNIDAAQFPPVPPTAPPSCTIHRFFSRDEAEAVEAIAARILPGDANDPGATEACVVTYIDSKLAGFEDFAEPTYTEGPFMKTYEGAKPPQTAEAVVWVAKDQADRYGFQGDGTPQDAYRKGLEELDAYTRKKYGQPFVGLAENDQDAVLSALEDGSASGFQDPGATPFFKMLRGDVIEGMFADPIYGGNRVFAGWNLIKYPGAQRGYTPHELRVGVRNRRPQGLKDMAPTHPGMTVNDNVIVPTQQRRRGVH